MASSAMGIIIIEPHRTMGGAMIIRVKIHMPGAMTNIICHREQYLHLIVLPQSMSGVIIGVGVRILITASVLLIKSE
jgi:hypothetical protein